MPLYLDEGVQAPVVSAQGLKPWVIKAADYTAVAGDRLLVDTSQGSWLLTLPSVPALGDSVAVLGVNDLSVNPLNITTGTAKLQATTEVISFRARYGACEFIYANSAQGWVTRPQGQLTTSTSATLTFSAAGDDKGVLYFIGTNYGAGNWGNPHAGGRVVVTPSSSLSPVAIVDRAHNSLNYSSNVAGSWVAVDLGAGNKLTPNHYSAQHDGETGYYQRNWKIQGANNVTANTVAALGAASWVDLDTRSNDTTLNAPHAWVSYPILGVTSAYRWLRFLSTGVDSSGSNYLMLGELEFYGSFVHLL